MGVGGWQVQVQKGAWRLRLRVVVWAQHGVGKLLFQELKVILVC